MVTADSAKKSIGGDEDRGDSGGERGRQTERTWRDSGFQSQSNWESLEGFE